VAAAELAGRVVVLDASRERPGVPNERWHAGLEAMVAIKASLRSLLVFIRRSPNPKIVCERELTVRWILRQEGKLRASAS